MLKVACAASGDTVHSVFLHAAREHIARYIPADEIAAARPASKRSASGAVSSDHAETGPQRSVQTACDTAPPSINTDFMSADEIAGLIQEGIEDAAAGNVREASAAFQEFRETHS